MTVNYLAILAAGVASMVVGFLWYSPLLFGNIWSKEMGFKIKSKAQLKKMQKEAGPLYLGTFIGHLIMAYVALHLLVYLRVSTLEQALLFAFWVWLGFIATTQASANLFSKKNLKLFLIDSSHMLAVLALQVVILLKL
jgi:hypothetical protein